MYLNHCIFLPNCFDATTSTTCTYIHVCITKMECLTCVCVCVCVCVSVCLSVCLSVILCRICWPTLQLLFSKLLPVSPHSLCVCLSVCVCLIHTHIHKNLSLSLSLCPSVSLSQTHSQFPPPPSLSLSPFSLSSSDPGQYLMNLQGAAADEETMMNLAIALSLQEEVEYSTTVE